MKSAELERDVRSAAEGHQRLLATIDGLSDAEVWQPSLLPDWTVGHVLTHLARNADSFVRMLRGAERGHVLDQYEGGAESRMADIEAGAGRSADAIVADLRTAIFHLEQAWDGATDVGWAGYGMTLRGNIPIATLPARRLVETEIHHVDLGVGYTIDDWPGDFVRRELQHLGGQWASRQPMGLTDLPRPVLGRPPAERLAWLAGRLDIDGVQPAGVFG